MTTGRNLPKTFHILALQKPGKPVGWPVPTQDCIANMFTERAAGTALTAGNQVTRFMNDILAHNDE